MAEPLDVWHCWYEPDGQFQITCDLPQPQPEGGAGEAVRAQWRHAVHSNDLGLAARLVREHPAAFVARRMYIPLYGPPDQDLLQAERLARAAMCARQPHCVVAFDRRIAPEPAE